MPRPGPSPWRTRWGGAAALAPVWGRSAGTGCTDSGFARAVLECHAAGVASLKPVFVLACLCSSMSAAYSASAAEVA